MRFFAVTGRVLNDALVKICKLNKALFLFFPFFKETLSCLKKRLRVKFKSHKVLGDENSDQSFFIIRQAPALKLRAQALLLFVTYDRTIVCLHKLHPPFSYFKNRFSYS